MQAQTKNADWRIDTDEFVAWCEKQADQSRSMTARVIVNDGDTVRFRIRESSERGPEDIVLIKGKEVDTIRFENGDNTRQFHLNRRDITLAEKTLLVKDDGREICRAGTGTKNKRGPFPV